MLCGDFQLCMHVLYGLFLLMQLSKGRCSLILIEKRFKLKRRVFEQPYLEMMKLDDSHNGRHCRSPCYSVDVRVSRPMCFPSPGGPAIAASQQCVVASVAVYLGLGIGWTASPQTGRHPAERWYLPVITNTASSFM